MILFYVLVGIAAIVLLVVNIRAMLAQIKTYELLKEVAEYGGFLNWQMSVAKREARQIITNGINSNPADIANLQTILSRFKEDKEAQDLIKKLGEIKAI